MSENWYTDEIRKTLHKERYFTSSHHYFFELKEAKNGSKYVVIDQRKKIGDKFVGAKMRIFADEMLEFHRILNKLIQMATYHDDVVLLSGQTDSSPPIDTDESYGVSIHTSASLFEKARSRLRNLLSSSQSRSVHSELQPDFFGKLIATENWQEFEKYTYYLLKLVGIQTVYNFWGERQAGKADGFFKIGNLAVLYDCTLRSGEIEKDK